MYEYEGQRSTLISSYIALHPCVCAYGAWVYVCAHVWDMYACGWVCLPVHVHMEARDRSWMSPSITLYLVFISFFNYLFIFVCTHFSYPQIPEDGFRSLGAAPL